MPFQIGADVMGRNHESWVWSLGLVLGRIETDRIEPCSHTKIIR